MVIEINVPVNQFIGFSERLWLVPVDTLRFQYVFCVHCGSRLVLTTNGRAYSCKEDAHRIVKRVRYICYGRTRKQTECDGQTGYTAHILDGIIDKVVRQIFERMRAIPKSEIVNIRYREKMEERKALLKSAKSDYAKAAAELDTLRAEVIKSLRGESAFPAELYPHVNRSERCPVKLPQQTVNGRRFLRAENFRLRFLPLL